MAERFNYRKFAFGHYAQFCAHCGFGISAVLEIAHIDGDRRNNDLKNLVILCPNCHKMHDLDIISTETIQMMRDQSKTANWRKRMKDAGRKAALTRKTKAASLRRKRRLTALKAVATRRKNK
jgi:predicted restriction endonuclease